MRQQRTQLGTRRQFGIVEEAADCSNGLLGREVARARVQRRVLSATFTNCIGQLKIREKRGEFDGLFFSDRGRSRLLPFSTAPFLEVSAGRSARYVF